MSVKAMSAAFEIGDHLGLAPVDRLILLRLGDWADDYGYAFPGVSDLVAKVGVDERTIRRHLTGLQKAGLLLRVFPGGGRHRSTLYRILPTVLPNIDEPPAVGRYQARYGVQVKGDILSGLSVGRGGTESKAKGVKRTKKGGHSYDPRSVMIHDDPSLEDLLRIQEQNPIREGESWSAYMKRLNT